MIIDSHVHIFSPKIIKSRNEITDPSFISLYSNPISKMITAEELIQSMDENEIQYSVVCNQTWSDSNYTKINNDYIMDVCTKYSNRLLPMITLPYYFDDRDITDIENYLDSGAYGIGEQRFPTNYLVDSYYPMMIMSKTLIEKKKILLLHASEPVGHTYPGKEKITPDVLYPFLSSVTGLTTILAHFGGGFGFYALMKEVREVLEDCYFDTAATPFLYQPEIYSVMKDLIGTEKILYATDCPLMNQQRVITHMKKSSIKQEDFDNILFKNASKLFGIKI